MEPLTSAEAAKRLNVSVRRVQRLVKAGRLPAKTFGGSLMIQEKDLKLVAERKVGRPSKVNAFKGKRRTDTESGGQQRVSRR